MRDGIENASVEFDPVSLKPTYRVMIGIPGSSNAFAVASRLGLSSAIVSEAKANLASHAEATDELIRRIEESHRVAAEQRRVAERTSSDAEALRKRYEEQLGKLDGARDRVEKQARERAEQLIASYERKLDGTLEQLAAQKKDSKRAQDLKKKAEKLLEQFEEQAVEAIQEPEPKEEPLPAGTELVRGTRVRIAGVNQDGEIVEPPEDGRVVVLMGSIRVTVPMASLRKARGEPEKALPDRSEESKIAMEKAREFHPELHLRGMRVEPALIEVEKYLDNAMAAGIDQVRLVHGKGTGQMKKAVWEFLKGHAGVKSYRIGEPEEGGAGATIVVIK
jgi:DNA mismatch repair protein MutS2